MVIFKPAHEIEPIINLIKKVDSYCLGDQLKFCIKKVIIAHRAEWNEINDHSSWAVKATANQICFWDVRDSYAPSLP